MQIEEFMKELQEIEPDLYYYPGHDFHITVMDILRGEKGRTVPEIRQFIKVSFSD